MELTIGKKIYTFKFGVKFIRELDKELPIEQEGIKYGLALTAKVLPELRSANVNTLAKVLSLANQTEENRITQDELDNYIDDAEDIEALFDQVLKSISESNAGKLATKNFDKQMKKAQKK